MSDDTGTSTGATSPLGIHDRTPLGFKIIMMQDDEKPHQQDRFVFPPPLDEPLNMALFLPVLTATHITDLQRSPEGGTILDVSSMLFDQLDMLRFANECLSKLLSYAQDTFWSVLCHDVSVMRFIDSFLLNYRGYCNAEIAKTAPLLAQPGTRMLLEQLSKRVLMVFLRMSTRKESTRNAPSSGTSSATLSSTNEATAKYRESEAVLLAEAGLERTPSNAKKSVGLASYWVDEYGALKEELYLDMFRKFPHLFPLYTFFDLCAIFGSSNESMLAPILSRLLDTQVAATTTGTISRDVLLDASAAGAHVQDRAAVLKPIVQVALEAMALSEHSLLTAASKSYINNKYPEILQRAVEICGADLSVLTPQRVKAASSTVQTSGSVTVAHALSDLSDSLFSLCAAQRLFPREICHALSSLSAFSTFVRLFESSIPAAAFYLRLGQPGYRTSATLAPALQYVFELARTYFACRIVEPIVDSQSYAQFLRESAGSEYVQVMQALVSTSNHGVPVYWLPPTAFARLQDEAVKLIAEEKTSAAGNSASSTGTQQQRLLTKLQELVPLLPSVAQAESTTNASDSATLSPYTEYGTLLFFLIRDPVAQVKPYISPRIALTSTTVPSNRFPVNIRIASALGGLVSNALGMQSGSRMNSDDTRLIRELSLQLPASLPILLQESALRLLKKLSQTTLPALVDAQLLEAGSKEAREHQELSATRLLGKNTPESGTNVTSKNSDPSLAELDEWIDSLREMFPMCGPGYLEAVLEHVHWKVDAAVAALLDESGKSLPKSLAKLADRDKLSWRPKSTVASRLEAKERAANMVSFEKSSHLAGVVRPSYETKSMAHKAVEQGILDEGEDEAFAEYLRSTGRTLKKKGTNINDFANDQEREMLKMHIRRMLVEDEYEDEYDDALDGFDEHFIVDDDLEDREKALAAAQRQRGPRGGKDSASATTTSSTRGGKPSARAKVGESDEEEEEAEEKNQPGEDSGENTEDDESEEKPRSNQGGQSQASQRRGEGSAKQKRSGASSSLDAKDLSVLAARRQAAKAASHGSEFKGDRKGRNTKGAKSMRGSGGSAFSERISLDDDDDDGVSGSINRQTGFVFGGAGGRNAGRGGTRGGSRAGSQGTERSGTPHRGRDVTSQTSQRGSRPKDPSQPQPQPDPESQASTTAANQKPPPPSRRQTNRGRGGTYNRIQF